jgi:hypothetical protein
MWVPMGLIYTAAALLIAAQWIAESGRRPVFTPGELLRLR